MKNKINNIITEVEKSTSLGYAAKVFNFSISDDEIESLKYRGYKSTTIDDKDYKETVVYSREM